MMKRKISVIIGGTGQIGTYIIRTLQKEGYLTVCVSSRPLNNSKRDQETDYYVFDMSQPRTIKMCCDEISKKYGTIDCLINALGNNRRGSICEITEEMWDEVIDTNLKSVFFICQVFKRILEPCNGSSIINFASTAGIRALPMSPHYVAAKAGVIALTEYFAQAFAPSIRVNCVAPGIVLTENHKPEKCADYDDMIKRIPLHQMVPIEEVVDAVLYLMKAKTITGHTLVVDGGLIL